MKWRLSWVEVEMELGVELELGNIRTLLSFIVTPQTTPPLLPSVSLVIENHNKDFYFPIES